MGKASWAIGRGNDSVLADVRFEIKLADNREAADVRRLVHAAPSAEELGNALIYLSSNRDAEMLATLNRHGELIWYRGEDLADDDNPGTLKAALHGFDEFAVMTSQECAEHLAFLFWARCRT